MHMYSPCKVQGEPTTPRRRTCSRLSMRRQEDPRAGQSDRVRSCHVRISPPVLVGSSESVATSTYCLRDAGRGEAMTYTKRHGRVARCKGPRLTGLARTGRAR